MANKYLIHGATYCGDGTTSAEATSAGAVGAWNNINVFEGTAPAYGSLAAGDTVYIRSKTGAGVDADVVITAGVSKTLGSAAATTSAWVTWVIDGGTIWSGVNGKVQYDCPSTYTITTRTFNAYIAENYEKLIIADTSTTLNKTYFNFASNGEQVFENLKLDNTANTSTNGSYVQSAGAQKTILRNLSYKSGPHYFSLLAPGQGGQIRLYSPSIELAVVDTRACIFDCAAYQARISVFGGKVFGVGATTGMSVGNVSGSGADLTLIGMRIPPTMSMKTSAVFNTPAKLAAIGIDTYAGAYIAEAWGEASTREDKYYPVRSAFLPDSAETPWSWWVYPSNCSMGNQLAIPTAKLYTAAAAAKTITLQFLIADTVTLANKATMWADITYIDNSSGLPVGITTRERSGGSLDTSSATWTARTYGETGFTKYQLSITTPTSIKQDTLVNVVLAATWKSVSANDIFIFCPDADLT